MANNTTRPACSRPRRQQDSVRALRQRLRQRLQPGHVHRRPGRAGRPLRPDRRATRHGRRRRGAQAQPRLQPDARMRAGQRAVALHPGLRPAAGLRHRPAGRDRRRRRHRAGPVRVGRRRRRGHHLRRADRVRRRPAPGACWACAAPSPTSTGSSWSASCPASVGIEIPLNSEPRTGMSMGEHAADHRQGDGRQARRPGRTGRCQPPATWPPPTTAASSTIWSRPFLGLYRDNNLRPDSSLEKLANAQAGVRGQGRRRDDDRGQLDPADRRRLGRAAVQRRVGRRRNGPSCWRTSSTPRSPRSTTSTAPTAC